MLYWVNLQGSNKNKNLIQQDCWNIKRMEEIVLDGNMNSGSRIVD